MQDTEVPAIEWRFLNVGVWPGLGLEPRTIGQQSNALRPKDTCIHLDAVEEHHTNATSLPASYRMMNG